MKKRYDFSTGRRGAIDPVSPGKTRITIRLDDDVLDWFREQADAAGGGNYQSAVGQRGVVVEQDGRVHGARSSGCGW